MEVNRTGNFRPGRFSLWTHSGLQGSLKFPPDRPAPLSEPADLGLDPEVHAQAFRDLEGAICDLERMGEIAHGLIMECLASLARIVFVGWSWLLSPWDSWQK